MDKYNTASMHMYLDKAAAQGESYKYPVYGIIKNTSFFATAYNQHRGCYLAVSEYRRLLFVECNALTCVPIRFGALGFDDLVSVKIKKALFGQYKIVLEFMIEGKKRKFIFRIARKVYCTDFDNQEQNLMGIIAELEKYNNNLRQ